MSKIIGILDSNLSQKRKDLSELFEERAQIETRSSELRLIEAEIKLDIKELENAIIKIKGN